jgi:hypothetical protein
MIVVVIRQRGGGGQGLVRPKRSPDAKGLGHSSVGDHDDDQHEHDVNQEDQIQNGHGPQLGILELALGGALHAAHHVQQPVTALGDEGVHVEGEAGLEDPEPLQAHGGAEADIGDEEFGAAGEEEAEQGGEGGDAGRDGVAPSLEIGGLDGGGGGGDGVLEEEETRGEGGVGVGEEEGEGEEEEKEEDGGGLKRGEAVDGGMTLEERVGVEGHEELVGEGDQEAEDEQVELKVFEEMRGRGERQGMEGFCGVGLWGFQVVAGGADEVVEPQRHQRRRREYLVPKACHFQRVNRHGVDLYTIQATIKRRCPQLNASSHEN